MKGLFIPEITAEMFRNGCLESIEALMTDGEIYDIEYEPERKKGKWKRRIVDSGYNADWICSECGYRVKTDFVNYNYCPNCGADMRGDRDED